MVTMNITLPGEMKTWVESRSGTGPYANAGDYMRDLIRQDQERHAKIAYMQALVDEARASGISRETMADIRTRALEQASPQR